MEPVWILTILWHGLSCVSTLPATCKLTTCNYRPRLIIFFHDRPGDRSLSGPSRVWDQGREPKLLNLISHFSVFTSTHASLTKGIRTTKSEKVSPKHSSFSHLIQSCQLRQCWNQRILQQQKKGYLLGIWPDIHWIKSLMFILLS